MLPVMPSPPREERVRKREKMVGKEDRFSHRAMIGEVLGFPEAWDD